MKKIFTYMAMVMAVVMFAACDDIYNSNNYYDEDDYYESLISGLYKPKPGTFGEVIAVEQIIPFEVEQAPEPEPAPEPIVVVEPEPEAEPYRPTALDGLKSWLKKVMKDVSE